MGKEGEKPPMTSLGFKRIPESRMVERSKELFKEWDKRRTVRFFSVDPVPIEIVHNLIRAASTAPSGAHKQPWTFCVVSSSDVKAKIRKAAEEEEYTNYHGRMSDSWLRDLEAFGTDWHKPFLEEAPYLIVIMRKAYDIDEAGEKTNNYYVNESVGIATGMFLAAAHMAGLATLTHTPSPMKFLTEILNRPENERPFLLIPLGYPAEDCMVPELARKTLAQVLVEY